MKRRRSHDLDKQQGQTRIDRIFDLCVDLLVWLADKLGMTYQQINVWIFCVLVPAIILGQTAAIIWLVCR
jgi:hypothetical protein